MLEKINKNIDNQLMITDPKKTSWEFTSNPNRVHAET